MSRDDVSGVLLSPATGGGGGARCRQLNISVTSLGRGAHGLDELLDVYCVGQGRRSVPLRPGFNHSVRSAGLNGDWVSVSAFVMCHPIL